MFPHVIHRAAAEIDRAVCSAGATGGVNCRPKRAGARNKLNLHLVVVNHLSRNLITSHACVRAPVIDHRFPRKRDLGYSPRPLHPVSPSRAMASRMKITGEDHRLQVKKERALLALLILIAKLGEGRPRRTEPTTDLIEIKSG